jgi:hypothetical protein
MTDMISFPNKSLQALQDRYLERINNIFFIFDKL